MSSPGQQRRPRIESAGASATNSTHVPALQPNTPTLPSIEPSDRSSSSARLSLTKHALQSTQSPNSPVFRVPVSPRSAGPESRGNKAAKVAIPRLKRSVDSNVEEITRTGGRHRVNHACEPCRHRKTKCSGERPVCRHCQDFKISCYYADGKRDRVKKQFGSMTEKVADYEKLMKSLLNKVGEEDARAIRALLEKGTTQDTEGSVDYADAETAEVDGASDSGAESEASAGRGSTGALDRTEEDFTRSDAKDTGFMGKTSEVTWLQKLKQVNMYEPSDERDDKDEFREKTGGGSPLGESRKDPRATPMAELEEGFAVKDSSYHLDDLPLDFQHVDQYEMPTPETANHLFTAYMSRVHPSFPIVRRAHLSSQFNKYFTGLINNPPSQWRAIVNLIFAIGAKYSHLIQAPWQGDERDHLVYFSRARTLITNDDIVFSHPDLQQVQVMGLMSFYLLCTSQVNRAWTLGGMAVRAAIALGLNVRNESSQLPDEHKEIRYRVWWALYTLESRLSTLTGRTYCISDEHCTTPLPIPFDEDQFGSEDARSLMKMDKQQVDRNPAGVLNTPNMTTSTPSTGRSRSASKPELSRSPSSQLQTGLEWVKDVSPNTSLYFLHLIQLTRISQNIFNRLYNPSSVVGSWSDIQGVIGELEGAVEAWYRELPPSLDFRRKQRDKDFIECRLNLAFLYYGTRITINRPCLCRLDSRIKGQSPKSLEFNRNSAAACIDSAQSLLGLMPDEPNAVGLNHIGPWWALLHYIMQATTALMLELSYRAHHMPEEADSIFENAKKGVRWLHKMGDDNYSARRAWLLTNSLLRDAAMRIGREVTDLPDLPPSGRESVSSHDHSDVSMHSNPFEPNIPYTTTQPMPNSVAYTNMPGMAGYDHMYPPGGFSAGLGYSQAEMDFITNMYPSHGQGQSIQPDQSTRGSSRSAYN